MPYTISGTKNETARIIVFKESDWSIENNAVHSGTGSYNIDSLVSGTKLVVAESNDGELLGYGNVTPIYYEEEVEPETVTFYWNSQNASTWTNPNNMVDGNKTITYAELSNYSSGSQTNNTNTSSDQGGAITKVEIRCQYDVSGVSLPLSLQPKFGGSTLGSTYNITVAMNGPHDSPWADITEDGEAPGTWSWSDLSALDLVVDGNPGPMPGGWVYVYNTEMQISYIPA